MKTKTLTYYVDLMAGWQDMPFQPCMSDTPMINNKIEGDKRVKVTVELPVFGGSADLDMSIDSVTEIVKSGLQE